MGNFKISLGITMGNEGGYNHGVGENETFFGIDRGYNPGWPGWKIVDQIKAAHPGKTDGKLDILFKADLDLIAAKDEFYKSGYWDTLKLDEVTDQRCCDILFDDNVNPCEVSAAHVMQAAAVACGAKINVDGQVGNLTVAAVNAIPGKAYYNAVIAIRELHYKDQVVKNPKQRQWLASWLDRLTAY